MRRLFRISAWLLILLLCVQLVPVGHDDAGDDRAEIRQGHGRAGRVGHGVEGNGLAVLGNAERLAGNGHGNVLLFDRASGLLLLYPNGGGCQGAWGVSRR